MAGVLEDCVAWKYLDKEAMHASGAQPGGGEGASLGASNGAAEWCCWEVGAGGTASQCGSAQLRSAEAEWCFSAWPSFPALPELDLK